MNKYYLIGEIHGTNECPKIFYKFIKNNNIKTVALEFSNKYQKEINKFYMENYNINDLSIFKNKETVHDGRASNAIKKLFIKLKKDKIKIIFIDDENSYGNNRDKILADNLSKIKGKVAFLCGNVHAMKKPLKLDKSSILYKKYPKGIVKTCGYYMNKENIVSINIQPINGGNFYNFSIKKYPKDLKLRESFNKSILPKIIDSNDKIFDFIYLIDRISYSR